MLGAQTDPGGWQARNGTNLMTTSEVVRALQRRPARRRQPFHRQRPPNPTAAMPATGVRNAGLAGRRWPTSAAASDCSTAHR
jgi:hypothetical protein